MDSNDRNLGMNSNITRRDFLNGVAVTVGASLIPGVGLAQNSGPDTSPLEPLLAQGIACAASARHDFHCRAGTAARFDSV